MRVALAYAGRVEDSAAIAWLRESQHADVIAVTLDLGQGRALEAVRDRALALGAQRAHVLDSRDEFVQRFVMPAVQADATREGGMPLGRALSRPLIAEKLLELAGIERADAVAYAGSHPHDSRLDRLLRTLAPAVRVLTPAREWAVSADDLAAFARRHGLAHGPADRSHEEVTLWGRTTRRRTAADASTFFAGARPGADCPDEAAFAEIAFEGGVPTMLNGVALPLLELVAALGTLAATHGVGRMESADMLCDAPAAVLIHAAHRELARAAHTPEVEQFSESVTREYVAVLDRGDWFSPLRPALDAFVQIAQRPACGRVRLRLHKGLHETIAVVVSQPGSRPETIHLSPR